MPRGVVRQVRQLRAAGGASGAHQEAQLEVNEWLGVLIAALNFHYGLCGQSASLGVPVGPPSQAQVLATQLLANEVHVFLEQCGGPLPELDWETEMKSSAVSYTGEEVYPSEVLELERSSGCWRRCPPLARLLRSTC